MIERPIGDAAFRQQLGSSGRRKSLPSEKLRHGLYECSSGVRCVLPFHNLTLLERMVYKVERSL